MLRVLRRLHKLPSFLIYLFIFAAILTRSTIDHHSTVIQLKRYSVDIGFNFVTWTVKAAWMKLEQFALGTSGYMEPEARSGVVLDYLQTLGAIQQATSQLRSIYSDPTVEDPETASADLRRQLNDLIAHRDQIGPLAESIFQGQASVVVTDLDLSFAGHPLPPLLFRVSTLPLALIVSPRTEIYQIANLSLDPDLPLEQQIIIEDRVYKELNVSPLVVPVGGVGTYPTMILSTANINFFAATVCHEWIHNYLTLHPLGVSYLNSPELRTMNETAASIAGDEMGLRLIELFYPEYLPVEQPEPSASTPSDQQQDRETPVFDYNAEMHETRLAVDNLLKQGQIELAEEYMEERRIYIWDNGYRIRKINQAFFAFYGAYADTPVGAAGSDPVGEAVRRLRDQSSSLGEFINTIAWMYKFEQLEKITFDQP